MKRFLQIANIVSLVFALVANVLVGAQLLDVPGINTVSDTYATLLTPAGYAFSIWSLIYTLLIVFVIYQARDLFKPKADNDIPYQAGPLFIIASICNGLWTYIFVNEWLGLSVIVLLVLTASLYMLLYRLRIAVFDAPRRVIACVWWPLLLYTGWVTIATVVNIASWLRGIGVNVSPVAACIVLAFVVVGLLFMLIKRNARELLLASAWGIFAIGVQQSQAGGNEAVMYSAFIGSGILVIACAIHGFMHRHSNPFLNRIS